VLAYPELLGGLAPFLLAGKCLVAGFWALFCNGGGIFSLSKQVLEPSKAEVLHHQGVMGSDLCDPMPA
jgi:hypothetical protein